MEIQASRSFDALVPGLDRQLLEGLAAARTSTRIVLGLTTDGDGKPREIHAPFLAMLPTDAIGYVLLPIDGDNVVRRFNEQLARIYEVLPLLCPKCGGGMRIIAFITEAALIQAILGHLGEPTSPPRPRPARGPPLWEMQDRGSDAINPQAQPMPDDAFDQRVAW